ncbi:hypothetical protein [Marmoricola sp. URHA0025 HA25]
MSLGGRVALVPDGTGIQIRPRDVAVSPSSSGVIPFRVTVSHGASRAIRVQQRSGGAEGDLPGPVVATDGDGWHFVADKS